MAFQIPTFNYKGIKRITIPKVDSDFSPENNYGWEIIKKYLSQILSTHKENAQKIEYLYNYFLGEQDILVKEREHDVKKKNNHKEIENHANRQVEFKVGFLCGETRDYTHKSDTDSDDLVYLDRYFTDCNFFSKDAELKEWIYSTGIGITKTIPRTDIIFKDKVSLFSRKPIYRYKTVEEGFNIEYEAPFRFDCIDPKTNFVVYSSNDEKEPLFCVSYVDVDISTENDLLPICEKQLHIETRYAWFRFNSDNKFSIFYWDNNIAPQPKNIHYLPFIEFSVNKDRIGIVEKNRSSFNTINLFRSAVNDMIVENSNAILVFKNVDIDSDTVKEMIKAGAVIISDTPVANSGGNADIRALTIEMPLDKMTTYLDQVMQNAYDIVGVPLASGQITSGGDTGQARLLGGGWNNAYIVINKEIQYIKGIDYEQLKLILMLCKQVPKCPLNEIYASQIDINYRVNQNDNLQVKAQSMKYLFDMHLPLEFILKVGGLSNDIKTDAKDWKASLEEFYATEQKNSQETVSETISVENNNTSQE